MALNNKNKPKGNYSKSKGRIKQENRIRAEYSKFLNSKLSDLKPHKIDKPEDPDILKDSDLWFSMMPLLSKMALVGTLTEKILESAERGLGRKISKRTLYQRFAIDKEEFGLSEEIRFKTFKQKHPALYQEYVDFLESKYGMALPPLADEIDVEEVSAEADSFAAKIKDEEQKKARERIFTAEDFHMQDDVAYATPEVVDAKTLDTDSGEKEEVQVSVGGVSETDLDGADEENNEVIENRTVIATPERVDSESDLEMNHDEFL
jgi:hypothetical protein